MKTPRFLLPFCELVICLVFAVLCVCCPVKAVNNQFGDISDAKEISLTDNSYSDSGTFNFSAYDVSGGPIYVYRYYKFTLDSSGKISFTTLDSSRDGAPSCAIYDADGTKLQSVSINSTVVNGNITFTVADGGADFYLTKGTYYFSVCGSGSDGKNSESYSYKVAMEFTSANESIEESTSDTNDTIEEADEISLYKTYRGQTGVNDTVDYYKFEITTKGCYTVNFAYDNAKSSSEGTCRFLNASGSVVSRGYTAIAPGTYYLEIKGRRDTYEFEITGICDTPEITSVTNTKSGIKVKWGAVKDMNGYDADAYGVYRRKSSSSEWELVARPRETSWTDTEVKSGTKYYYTVQALWEDSLTNLWPASNYDTTGVSIKNLKAGAISSLTNTSSGITVKWSKVSGASGYYVYRKTGSKSYSKVKTVTSGSTVKWTDTAVKKKNGTTYKYYVVPYYKSSSGKITKGTYKSAKTTIRLTAVTLTSAKNSSSKAFTVVWKKNAKATGYELQWSTSKKFTSSTTKSYKCSGKNYLKKKIGSLKTFTSYYVRVRVYKKSSGGTYYSAWSKTKGVRISK